MSALAVFLGRHLWLEKRHRRSIEIELSGDSLFLLRRLVSQDLDVLLGLDVHMKAAWNWLWRWNVTVRVDLSWTFWSAVELFMLRKADDRYLPD